MPTGTLRPPKIIYLDKPISIGLAGSDQWLYNGKREALLVSESHRRLRDGGWSGGGPFMCVKESLEHTGTVHDIVRNTVGGKYSIKGVTDAPQKLGDVATWIAQRNDWVQRELVINTFYATGWKRARPGNAVASLGQFLLELRDMPVVPFRRALKGAVAFESIPRIALRELTDFRNLGSEYLNVAFGWRPFVDDLRKMYNLWHTIDNRMAQIVRENGKWIRRRSQVLKTVTATEEPRVNYPAPWYHCYGAPPNWTNGSSVWQKKVVTKRKVWFSGSFRYYIPDVGSSQWDRRARLALFGALPTPELIWNVLPWSWLTDWFGNLGDVISNASPNAVDNLISRYAYVMMQDEIETVWQVDSWSRGLITTPPPFTNRAARLESTHKTTQKVVIKARSSTGSPFGLGVVMEPLTDYQTSILAALGVSKSKFH